MGRLISAALSSTTIIICLVLVYYLSATELFSDRLVGTKRTILIVMLSVYAVFRIYKVYRLFKK